MSESGETKPRRRRKRRGLGRILRGVLIVLAVLIAIPVVLTPVYLVIDPVSVPMLERYLTGRPVVRDWRPIGQISDRLKAAVVLSEDGQFCRHWGVDIRALKDEIDLMLVGKDFRGASTITMQVARNLFLTNQQFFLRKALEVPLALYVDLVLPKRRIMEIYLNIAEWGRRGSSAPKPGPGRRSGQMPASSAGSGPASWPSPCPIRSNGGPVGPAAASGASRRLWKAAPDSMESVPIASRTAARWRFNKH